MTHAKKLIVPVLCILLGCAGGAAMGNVTAQTYPPNPQAARWQQECQAIDFGGMSRERNVARANAVMRERGEQGWELVGQITDGVPCFKRPAP